jgi:hypothetical protein
MRVLGCWDCKQVSSGDCGKHGPLVVGALESSSPAPSTLRERLTHLEARLGLHEELSIIYVVDGYQATLLTSDGAVALAAASGPTIAEALNRLSDVLRVLDEEKEK